MNFSHFLNVSREYAAGAEGGKGGEYPYLFDRQILSQTPSLHTDFSTPSFLSSIGWINQNKNQNDNQNNGDSGKATLGEKHGEKQTETGGAAGSEFFISVGNSDTGTVLHQHFEAFNVLVVGSKRWFLYPPHTVPPVEYPPHRTIRKWLSEVYTPVLAGDSKLAPMECTVQPGEVLYLPAGWFHATINIGETVSVSKQQRPAMGGLKPPPPPDDGADGASNHCVNENCAANNGGDAPTWLWYKQKLERVLNGGYPDVTGEEAMAMAQALVDLRPLSSEAFVLFAHVLGQLGDFESAVEAARRAVEVEGPCENPP